jgi:hypothetical protein
MGRDLCRFLLVIVCVGCGLVADASARSAAPVQVRVANGSCRVRIVTAAEPTMAREFEVRVNTVSVRRVTLEAGQTEAVAVLNVPVTGTDEISVRRGADVFVTTERLLAPPEGEKQCAPAPRVSDARDGFSASFYIGGAVDNFAPSRLGDYVEDPTVPNKTRMIGGIDFEYRLFGSNTADVQIWIQGETLHGVKTADVNCAEPHAPPTCNGDPVSLGEAGSTLRYIIKHASSLEAFITPRLELYTFNRNSENAAAKLYVSTRFGMIGLSDAPKSFPAHHFGLGIASIRGNYDGSAIEIGWGSNDLFEPPGRSRYYRFKLDALLSMDIIPDLIKNVTGSPRPFIQFYLDNDIRGPGADSIQTFFGLDFNLRGR